MKFHRIQYWLALVLGSSCLCAAGLAATDDRGEREQQVLIPLGPLAKRQGKQLILRLNGGKDVVLRSTDPCADPSTDPELCLEYRLLGLSPNGKFFVVEALAWESGTWLWIGRDSGTQYEVYDEPHLSPTGEWLVTANPSEYGGTNGVFVWSVSGDRLIEELHYEPQEYALYSFVRWEGPDSLRLSKYTHADKSVCSSAQAMEHDVLLRRVGSSWKFDEKSGLKSARCK